MEVWIPIQESTGWIGRAEMSGMSNPAVLLRYLAFALMTLVGVLGGVFAVGYAFSDLDTTQAVGTTAPWLVLAIALSVFASRSRRIAPWALAVLTAFTVVRTPVESALGLTDRNDPFSAIWVLVLAVALGFLGLHHTRLAGGLLAVLGVGQLVALLVSADRDGAGWADLVGTSSGVVVVPVLVVAALFLAADVLDRGRHGRPPPETTLHPPTRTPHQRRRRSR